MLSATFTKHRAFAPVALPDRRWPDTGVGTASSLVSASLKATAFGVKRGVVRFEAVTA